MREKSKLILGTEYYVDVRDNTIGIVRPYAIKGRNSEGLTIYKCQTSKGYDEYYDEYNELFNGIECELIYNNDTDSVLVLDDETLMIRNIKLYEKVVDQDRRVHLLALVGPSGGGKTYLEKMLKELHPKKFTDLIQVTTRERRSPEDEYLFTTKEHFEKIKELLIGRVGMDSKFGNYYGTIPLLDPDKINTIILSEEGLKDMFSYIKDNDNVLMDIIYVDSGFGEKRKNRDESFIMEERKLKDLALFEAYPEGSDKDINETINRVTRNVFQGKNISL